VSEWSLIFFVYLGIKATASTRPRSSEEPESVQQAQQCWVPQEKSYLLSQ
jgi:hypothetical protein